MRRSPREAGRLWERGLCVLLECKEKEELRRWWEREGEREPQCGMAGSMIAATLAVKLARYTCKHTLMFLTPILSQIRSLKQSQYLSTIPSYCIGPLQGIYTYITYPSYICTYLLYHCTYTVCVYSFTYTLSLLSIIECSIVCHA